MLCPIEMSEPKQGCHRRLTLVAAMLGASFLLAFFVRLIGFQQEAFFIDEASTLLFVQEPTITRLLEGEVNPPIYFWFLALWSGLFGTSHEALRLPSVLFGAATVPVLLAAARAWGAGRAAMLLLAVATIFSPMHVWWSQIARPYALSALLMAAVLLAVAKLQRCPRSTAWGVTLAALVLLGQATHYWFCFPVAGLWMVMAIASSGNREHRRAFLWLNAGCLGWLALVPLVLAQQRTGNAAWVPRAELSDLLRTPLEIWLTGPFSSLSIWTKVVVYTTAVATAGLWGWNRRRGRLYGIQSHLLAACLAATVLGLLIPWLISRLTPLSIYLGERYTLVAWPAFVLAGAMLVHQIAATAWRRVFTAAWIVVLSATSLPILWKNATTFQDFDWRRAIRIVAEEDAQIPMIFLPGWMQQTWLTNGGVAPKNALTLAEATTWVEPMWVIYWKQSPDAAEQHWLRELQADGRMQSRVDFPHMELARVSPSGHQ